MQNAENSSTTSSNIKLSFVSEHKRKISFKTNTPNTQETILGLARKCGSMSLQTQNLSMFLKQSISSKQQIYNLHQTL